MKDKNIAGLLSFFVPGTGQIYNGNYGWAIFWMLVVPGLWIASQGFFGWILHILCSYAAYTAAKEKTLEHV